MIVNNPQTQRHLYYQAEVNPAPTSLHSQYGRSDSSESARQQSIYPGSSTQSQDLSELLNHLAELIQRFKPQLEQTLQSLGFNASVTATATPTVANAGKELAARKRNDEQIQMPQNIFDTLPPEAKRIPREYLNRMYNDYVRRNEESKQLGETGASFEQYAKGLAPKLVKYGAAASDTLAGTNLVPYADAVLAIYSLYKNIDSGNYLGAGISALNTANTMYNAYNAITGLSSTGAVGTSSSAGASSNIIGLSGGTMAAITGGLAAVYQGYQNISNVQEAKDKAGGYLTDEEIENAGDPYGGKYKDISLLHRFGGPEEYLSPFTWKNHALTTLFGTSKDKYEIYRNRVRDKLAEFGYLGTDDAGRRYVELANGSRFDFQTEGRTFRGQDGRDVRYADQFDESNPLLGQAQGGLTPLLHIIFGGSEGVPGFDAGLVNAMLSNAHNEKELYANIAHQYARMGLDQTSATEFITQLEAQGKISKEEADASRVAIYKALDPVGYERDRPKANPLADTASIELEYTPGAPRTPDSRQAGVALPPGEIEAQS